MLHPTINAPLGAKATQLRAPGNRTITIVSHNSRMPFRSFLRPGIRPVISPVLYQGGPLIADDDLVYATELPIPEPPRRAYRGRYTDGDSSPDNGALMGVAYVQDGQSYGGCAQDPGPRASAGLGQSYDPLWDSTNTLIAGCCLGLDDPRQATRPQRAHKGVYTQPGTQCGYPPNGEPYPWRGDAPGVDPLPFAAVAGDDPREVIKAYFDQRTRDMILAVIQRMVHDPLFYLSMGTRIFVPSLGWLPFIAYQLFSTYRTLR